MYLDQALHCRWLLELGHDLKLRSGQSPQLVDVLGALHEGQSHPVDLETQDAREIPAKQKYELRTQPKNVRANAPLILFGERGNGQHDTWCVHSLVIRQWTAQHHLTLHVSLLACRGVHGGAHYSHAQSTVVQQHHVAPLESEQDLGMGQAHSICRAQLLHIQIESELLTG